MDLSFYLYLFLVLASVLGGTYYFFKQDNTITGSIYLIGSVVISAYFGSRWFMASGVRTGGTWPPAVNVCPDFMSLVTLTPASSGTSASAPETVCVDTIGIYSNGVSKWTPGSTSESTIFHLFATQEPKLRMTSLCDQSKAKNVTWEGFYMDGTCGDTLPPLPAGMAVAPPVAAAATATAAAARAPAAAAAAPAAARSTPVP
jgi:hypothetical protein